MGLIKWTLFKIGGRFHFFLLCTSFLAVTYFAVLSEQPSPDAEAELKVGTGVVIYEAIYRKYIGRPGSL